MPAASESPPPCPHSEPRPTAPASPPPHPEPRAQGQKRARGVCSVEVDALAMKLGSTVLRDPAADPPAPAQAKRARVVFGAARRGSKVGGGAPPPPRGAGVKRIAGAPADALVSRFAKVVRLDLAPPSPSQSPTPPPSPASSPLSPAAATADGDGADKDNEEEWRFGADSIRRYMAAAPHLKCWLRSDAAAPVLRDLIGGLHTGVECFAVWPDGVQLAGGHPRKVIGMPELSLPTPGRGVPPHSSSLRQVVRTLHLEPEAVREVLRAAGVIIYPDVDADAQLGKAAGGDTGMAEDGARACCAPGRGVGRKAGGGDSMDTDTDGG